MRSYETIITEAEYLAIAPQAVRERLALRAAQSKDDWRQDTLDEKGEESLRLRRDPLIDLSLAQYARNTATVKPLFDASELTSAHRLAILSNQSLGKGSFSRFPMGLFDSSEKCKRWLLRGDLVELKALFQNPHVQQDFLRDLLEGKEDWAQLPDARMTQIVSFLCSNERMRTEYDNSHMDGFAEYSHNAVFDAAWSLAERVEPTEQWAKALSWLFADLYRQSFSLKEPMKTLERWRPDPSNAELVANDAKTSTGGFLSPYEMVRMSLARLASKRDYKLVESFLSSDDRALRAAAYSDANLNAEQLTSAYEKDGQMLFNQAISNDEIWRDAGLRPVLRAIAWRVSSDHQASDLGAVNHFNAIEQRMKDRNPQWFEEEEPESDADDKHYFAPDDAPASKSDLAALERRLGRVQQGGLLDEISKHINWLLMMGGATVTAILFKLW